MLKTRLHRLVMVALLVLGFSAVAAAAQPKLGYKGYSRGGALITAKELKQLIDSKDPKLVIVAAENEVEYRLGHIPGSFKVTRL
jgi:thiosulfate/3-mercaptopyruvate sulfurtransferase